MLTLSPHTPSVPLPFSACSKAVGYRFGKHLGRGVPLAIRYLRGAAEGDEELREYCLQVTAPCCWVRCTLFTAISSLEMLPVCYATCLRHCPGVQRVCEGPGAARIDLGSLFVPRRRWRALCSAARRTHARSWARSCPPASSSCGALGWLGAQLQLA